MEVTNLWEILSPRLHNRMRAGLTITRIAQICDVKSATVIHWCDNEHPPMGERLVKLWHLLRWAGAESSELDDLPKYNAYLGELFTLGILDMPTIQELLSVKVTQSALKTLRGQPSAQTALSLAELREAYDTEHQLRRTALLEELSSEISDTQPTPAVAAPPNIVAEAATTAAELSGNPGLLLATLLGAALPSATWLVENGTPEARSDFRSLVGLEELFKLSNLLNALGSERALQHRK